MTHITAITPLSSAATAGHATIRPARTDDMPQVAAIYRRHVLHGCASFETEPPTLDEMVRRHVALCDAGLPYLVAATGGMVVGYAYAGPWRMRAAYRDTVENSIYLRTDMAGRGIGGALLAALVGTCETLGFRQMVAVVGDSANLPSIRLHQRHGFRMVGTLQAVGFKHGRWLDSVLLQRALGQGGTMPPAR